MAIRRREFLAGTLGALALRPGFVRGAGGGPRFLGCRRTADGGHDVGAVDGAGRLLYSVPLPGRGHGVAVSEKRGECAVLARRPGRFLLIFDLAYGRLRQRLESPADRHYYGHGVYNRDGSLLFATENDYAAGHGVIGVYDTAAGYRRVAELPGHGVGPHEIGLLKDDRTLVVANGGILTHPDFGRAKLNLDTMSPTLSFVDARDGRLLAERRLDPALHQLSMRHVDARRDGTVAIAMQHQGPASESVPLIGLYRPGKKIQLLEPPPGIAARMRNYCGSVCFNASGDRFAVSSPRGGLVTLWSGDGGYLGHVDLPDGCGVAPDPRDDGFVLSSGEGAVIMVDGTTASASHAFPGAHWDNHMAAVS